MGDGSFGFGGEMEAIVRLKSAGDDGGDLQRRLRWIKAGKKGRFNERYYSVIPTAPTTRVAGHSA